MVMNVKPPVAEELWQQVPPPVQSALLEAWAQAEQRRQSLEEQLRQLRGWKGHVDADQEKVTALQEQLRQARGWKDPPSTFAQPLLTPTEKPNPVPPEQDTKLSRGRQRRQHRTAQEKREQRRERMDELIRRYLFWPALIVAVVLILWGVLLLTNPGNAPTVRGR